MIEVIENYAQKLIKKGEKRNLIQSKLQMLPYSQSLIMDNAHNYGIVQTETVFGFGPSGQNNYLNNSFNAMEPLQWIFNNRDFQKRSLQDMKKPKATSLTKADPKLSRNTKSSKKAKKKKRHSKKINKCIIKFMKGQNQGGGNQNEESYGGKKTRRRRRVNKVQKMQKKYLMPVILGLLAAKSLLIPVALKALAFMSAKGLMLAFFSTVLASVMSLKGMFNQPHEYHNRKDDSKTQVEIIQVPTKSEDHVYYDEHYKRGDYIPSIPYDDVYFTKNFNRWKGMNERNIYSNDKVNQFQTQMPSPILTQA